MPFETKKVNTETLSEYLVGVRKQHKFSLEDVSQFTGIPVKFIECLESGKFHHLPPTVYVRGFLKKISELYEISEKSLVEQFKKERGISQEIVKQAEPQVSGIKLWLNKIIVTPKLISLSAAVFFILVTVGYIIFEVSSIYGTPKLIINEPKDGQKISSSVVSVSGQTDPGTSLTINDQLILVDAENGKFNAMVSVNQGQKDLSFVATNKFSKSNNKKVSILVDIPVTNTADTQVKENLKLTLNFTDQTSIIYKTDEGQPITEDYAPGSTKVISATDKVLLSTSNAGATLVMLNNKQLGPLGKKNEKLIDVPFTTDTLNALAKSDKGNTKQISN